MNKRLLKDFYINKYNSDITVWQALRRHEYFKTTQSKFVKEYQNVRISAFLVKK